MSNLKLIEIEITRKINRFKELYFNLTADMDVNDYCDQSYNELEKIKEYIEQRLNIKDFPPLLSKIYVYNRKKIRELDDQYRREISVGVQCLKDTNTVFIDPNPEVDSLGFNNIGSF